MKVFDIFQTIFTQANKVSEVKEALEKSDICKYLLDLVSQTTHTLVSGRSIRHGQMGFAVKLSNLIVKCEFYESLQCPGWSEFVEGELATSNTNDEFALGNFSREKPNDDSGDEPMLDNDMQRIMERLSNFIQQQKMRVVETRDNDEDDDDSPNPLTSELTEIVTGGLTTESTDIFSIPSKDCPAPERDTELVVPEDEPLA